MKTNNKAAVATANEVPSENFTVPIISTTNPKEWYIYFEFFHAGKWHERKLRKGINRYELKERKKEAEALRDATHDKLKAGWNPIIDPEFKSRQLAQNTESIHSLGFNDALDFALQKKSPDLAKKSIQDYRNILSIIKTKAIKSGLAYLEVKKVTRLHMLNLLDELFVEKQMSNHRFNMVLGCVRSMFTTLETYTICEYNPASKIPKKPVAESDKFESYTEDEKRRIVEHLAVKHYRLFAFMQVIYHTGIRPKELLLLRIRDVDLKRRVITLTPDLKEETTKTKFIRPVPISNHLFPFFKEMNLDQWPPEFFVFGSPFEPGKGNRGAGSERWGKSFKKGKGFLTGRSGAMRSDYLAPSPWSASRDTVGKLWQSLVKEDLGIDKCLYAAKHTGADDKILAGIDLDALRNLYGHRSKQMTERYAKQIREVYHSNIIDKAPAFISQKKPAKLRKIA